MLFILVLLIVLGLTYSIMETYADYKNQVNALVFHQIDISALPDTTYLGEYDTAVIYACVELLIKNRTSAEFHLRSHRHERGGKVNATVRHMLEQQQFDVDSIASATNSSKVLRTTIE